MTTRTDLVKEAVFTVLKENALAEPGGLKGQPIDITILTIALGIKPIATADEVRQAVGALAVEGRMTILPPKEGDSHDFWVRIPLTAAERQKRSRAMRKRQGLKSVTIYLPEGKSPEETAAREAELKVWINERWGKEPSLI